MKEQIRSKLLDSGAIAVGFAKAGEISEEAYKIHENWIGEGCNGEMHYLQRHLSLKQNTDNVMKGAQTVISIAFSYNPEKWREANLPYIASYAYGNDYHIVIREKLSPLMKMFKENYGGNWRICIDSAPIAERYWAIKSGVGKRGVNGAVIVDGCGALCFIVEILTTLVFEPDSPNDGFCNKCGRCVQECPSKALRGDGTMDARKCINYLSIEKKGNFSEEEIKLIKSGKGYFFGCDRCLRVCPHNKESYPHHIQKISDSRILELMPDDILSMDEKEFKRIFNRSPLLYAGYEKLIRNANAIKDKRD